MQMPERQTAPESEGLLEREQGRDAPPADRPACCPPRSRSRAAGREARDRRGGAVAAGHGRLLAHGECRGFIDRPHHPPFRFRRLSAVGPDVDNDGFGACEGARCQRERQRLGGAAPQFLVWRGEVDQVGAVKEEPQPVLAQSGREGFDLARGREARPPRARVGVEDLHGLGAYIHGSPRDRREAAGGGELGPDDGKVRGRVRAGVAHRLRI